MALMNYSLPFGGIGPTTNNWGTIATGLQAPHANAVNGLIYDPAAHQQQDPSASYGPDYYRNNPYAPPHSHTQSNFRNQNYLPPHPTIAHYSQQRGPPQVTPTRTYGENSYSNTGRGSVKNGVSTSTTTTIAQSQFNFNEYSRNSQPASFNTRPTVSRPATQRPTSTTQSRLNQQTRPASSAGKTSENEDKESGGIPGRPSGYVKVQGGQGKNTHTVAVLDYDDDEEDGAVEDDEYYDAADGLNPNSGKSFLL